MNIFKRHNLSRVVSLILVVVLLLSTNSYSVSGVSDQTVSQNIEELPEQTNENYRKDDLTIEELASATLAEADRPEAVSAAEVENGGHVHRLYAQEKDLNTVIFQNSDGSKTMYYYAEPVKYIDEEGTVQDKSNTLTASVDKSHSDEYGFVNAGNDIQTYFPKSLGSASGVLLEYDDISIELKPIKAGRALSTSIAKKVQSADDFSTANEAVAYDGVFGLGSQIQYTPTFNGFKEDIILNSYTGINEFSFILQTNGLCLVNDNGVYYLADPKTGNPEVNIGELIIYDSSEDATKETTAYNHYYVMKTVKPNNEYRITIVVDEDYLTSSDTVYPVTVDPSFDIVSTNNGIMDICVSQSGAISKGTILYAGRLTSDETAYRTFIKFPGLLDSWQWAALAPSGFGGDNYPEITSLTLNLYNKGYGIGNAPVDAYLYSGTNAVDWSYTTNGTLPTSFSSANFNAKGSLASSTTLGIADGWTSIDLTDISDLNLTKGIVIQNRYEGINDNPVLKGFHSTRNTNKPKITVTWQDISHTSFATAKTVSLNTNYNVPILSANTKHYFAFTPSATGFYTIESNSIISGDPYGWLYNSSQVQLAKDDDSNGNRNFRMVYHLDAGQKYYIAAGCFSTGIGRYSFKITSNSSATNLSPVATLAIGTTQSININTSRGRKFLKFTAPKTETYIFRSSGNGTSDPYGWLYNLNAVLVASNDDGAGNRNFEIECDLTAGQTVYLVVGCYGSGSGNFSVSVTPKTIKQISQELNAGDYLSIPFAVSDTSDLNSIDFSISYNSADFELIDACEFSSVPVWETGSVSGTNINITEVSANKVSFNISTNTTVQPGIVNIIKLRAKRTGTHTVTCSAG